MIPRIDTVEVKNNSHLLVKFQSGERVLYDVGDDINTIEEFSVLKTEPHLFAHVQVDESRTCVFWNDFADLPSDTLLEYGQRIDVDTGE